MKDFSTAARNANQPRESFTFKLDGEDITTIRPSESLIVMLMAAQGSEVRSQESRLAGMIDGAMSLFDDQSRRLLSRRLLDPEDPFGWDTDNDDADLLTIVQEVIEEWSERPTRLSSDSTSPSEDSGTASTDGASVKELTSSVSS